MTLAKTLRGLTFGALAAALTLGSVSAQNGTNYHVLTNAGDFLYSGIGAGGLQTFNDGLGTYIAGEDMRGSHITSLAEFGYRLTNLRHAVCALSPVIEFNLMMVELDGGTGSTGNGFGPNNPVIFTNPACTPGSSFPINGSAGFVPYGTGPGTSFSFLFTLLPSFGLPSGHVALLPDNGLITSGAGGTATIVVAGAGINVNTTSSGCYNVQFGFTASAVPFLDNIDGMWSYLWNNTDVDQIPIFSGDEMNIWQSQTLVTDAGSTAIFAFLAQTDYELTLATIEPQTHVSLAPRGLDPFLLAVAAGPYYTETSNVGNENGIPFNPNGGFDVGRGSAAISFSGTAGVINVGTNLGNQHISNNPAAPTTSGTLGFATWDNGADQNGSVRLTWLSVDFLGAGGLDPAADPGLVLFGGTIRVPVVTAGLLQPLTNLGFGLFGHVTSSSGWLDPSGFGNGAFGVTSVTGASWQLPTGPQPAACAGAPFGVNITYGTSSRFDGPGGLNWDPSIGDTSGSKQVFLFD